MSQELGMLKGRKTGSGSAAWWGIWESCGSDRLRYPHMQQDLLRPLQFDSDLFHWKRKDCSSVWTLGAPIFSVSWWSVHSKELHSPWSWSQHLWAVWGRWKGASCATTQDTRCENILEFPTKDRWDPDPAHSYSHPYSLPHIHPVQTELDRLKSPPKSETENCKPEGREARTK